MQGDVTNLGSLENTYNTEQQAQLQKDLEKSKEKPLQNCKLPKVD